MRHLTLVAYEDQPTGTLGLIIKGCDGPEIFSDTSGRLLAHDILEHQNGIDAIGCIGDELEALGALWQVRGRQGDLVDDRGYGWQDPIRAVAADVNTCATDFDCQESHSWYPRIGQYRTRPHDYDDDFQAILEAAAKDIPLNIGSESMESFPMEAFMDNALHLMRIGFNKAKRRFGMGYEGVSTFRAIRDAIAGAAKHIEFEGQEFRLAYGNCEARCYEIIHRHEW